MFTIPAQLSHLIGDYITDQTADIERLRALAQGPRDVLAEQAHATGGKCALFGDHELAAMLFALEREIAGLDDADLAVRVGGILIRAQAALDTLIK